MEEVVVAVDQLVVLKLRAEEKTLRALGAGERLSWLSVLCEEKHRVIQLILYTQMSYNHLQNKLNTIEYFIHELN